MIEARGDSRSGMNYGVLILSTFVYGLWRMCHVLFCISHSFVIVICS
jgi:hypothetical protein